MDSVPLAPRVETAPPTPSPLPPEYHFDPDLFGDLLDQKAAFVFKDDVLGCTIASDFDRDVVAACFSPALEECCADLKIIFRKADASRLVIRLHARPPIAIDGVLVDSVHRGREVHVFALESAHDANPSPHASSHLRHELVHAFLFLSNRTPPRWLEEGLAQTLSDLLHDSNGGLEPRPRADFIVGLGKLHREHRALDLEDILRATDAYPDPKQLGAFYVGTWSFTHFALSTLTGDLAARVEELEHLPPSQRLALEPEWRRIATNADPAAAWLPFIDRHDPLLAADAEDALRDIHQDLAWWECVLRLSQFDSPQERLRAIRLIEIASDDRAAKVALERMTNDADPEVRCAVTTALARTGDLSALIAALEDLRATSDPKVVVSGLLAILDLLPEAAHAPRADAILQPDFPAAATADQLAQWILDHRDSIEFDPSTRRFVRIVIAPTPASPPH